MLNFTDFLRKKFPNEDFEHYRYMIGDIIQLDDGAIVLCTCPAVEYIRAYVVKRSLTYREYKEYTISRKDLPTVNKGEFTDATYKIQKKKIWKVGDIVETDYANTIVYPYSEEYHQCFYGWVIKTDNNFYLHTGIYLENPYKDYIKMNKV